MSNSRPRPIHIRARSPSIWYRGEMRSPPPRSPIRKKITLKPLDSRHEMHEKACEEEESDLVAWGKGDEWVLSEDSNSVRRWYKGEWKANRLDGQGTIFDEKNGLLEFRGHFENGKRQGFGKQFSTATTTRVLFRGHFVNDKKEGLGAVFFDNGRLCYEGSLKNGFYHGLGTLYYRADNQFSRRVASYVGPFVKNMRWGSSGKEYDQQGRLLYHGAWMLNHKVGHGRAYHTVVASASSSCSEEGGEEGKKKLSFIGRFENRTPSLCGGRGVVHGGSGCLFLLDGRRFISSSFHDGSVDDLVLSTMFYPDGRVVQGHFHKINLEWITETGVEPEKQVWRGSGTILWPNGNRYVGDFRDGVAHSGCHEGLLTTRGLDQFRGIWKNGACEPSVSAREVVRKGLCLIFSFNRYPSHITDPPGIKYEAEMFHELMEEYQFEVWREENTRYQAVCQTLVEAQRHLKQNADTYDMLVVFTAGMGLRPGVTTTCDLKEFPDPDEFLNDEFIPSLAAMPKLFIDCCSYAPPDTKGRLSQKRFFQMTSSKNLIRISSTRSGARIWDESDQGCEMVRCLCDNVRKMCSKSLEQKPVLGINLDVLLETLRERGDALLPFENICCLRVNPTKTKIQLLRAEEMVAMDSEHVYQHILEMSKALSKDVMLEVMKRF